jgi:hypothetical protein
MDNGQALTGRGLNGGGRREGWVKPAIIAMILAGYGACLFVNYPGHFTFDSVWQLAQGRTGIYNDWHPPVMAWLLGLADRALPGAWLFIALDGALFYGGLLAFALLAPRPRPIGLPLLLLWMISPLTVIYQGVALKDVLFANAAMAGFAALAWADRLWARPIARWPLLGAALALFTLAALTRQNGAVVPLCGALAAGAMAIDHGPPGLGLGRRAAAAGLGGVLMLGLTLGAMALATAALETHGDHRPENANHVKILRVFDLAGAARRAPDLDLAVLRREQPALARFIADDAAPRWRAAGVDNLVALPRARGLMPPPGEAVGRQWRALVAARPWLYLETRAAVWRATLETRPEDLCPMVFTGVEGDPAALKRAGLTPRQTDRDDADDDYAEAFHPTPLFSHLAYALILALVAALDLRAGRDGGREPGRIAALAMATAAALFALSFFVVSVDCDYRYLYFLDVAAMTAAVRRAATRPPALRAG